MSKLMINDLAGSRKLEAREMAGVRGGMSKFSELGPFANVNVEVNQNIVQFQDIEVNALNNVGVIGAGFGPLKLDVSPKQRAKLAVAF